MFKILYIPKLKRNPKLFKNLIFGKFWVYYCDPGVESWIYSRFDRENFGPNFCFEFGHTQTLSLHKLTKFTHHGSHDAALVGALKTANSWMRMMRVRWSPRYIYERAAADEKILAGGLWYTFAWGGSDRLTIAPFLCTLRFGPVRLSPIWIVTCWDQICT